MPRDPVEAFKWVQAAAQQGNADAQNNLGYLYKTGQGTKRDYAGLPLRPKEGFRWHRSNLGAMYQNGQGVPLDYVEASKWFSLAAAQGNEAAANARKSLASIMTKQELSAVEDRLTAW